MRVLIACEFSGVVRDAFIKKGHEAVSCDLLETENPGPHIKGDIAPVLKQGWDLMIAHPPCTHLSVSGATFWREKKADGRQQQGINFFMLLADAPIDRIAIENPVGIMSTVYRKPDQYIQPYEFGHPESKKTGLWLKGLPPLMATEILITHNPARWANQTPGGQNSLPPSKDRWKIRSRTYQGIADAMAGQWGETKL